MYGGGNKAETDSSVLNLNSGTVTTAFGGGNEAAVGEPYVYCNGTLIGSVFGGSNANGTVPESTVEINSGVIENAYGGNNRGGKTEITNIYVNGGRVTNIFGGGDKAETTTSNINTIGGIVTNIFGGGNQAGVVTTNVTTNGGTIENLFGGSNKSGNVTTSNVTTNDPNSDDENTGKFEMTVTKSQVSEAGWRSTIYPTYAKIVVTLTNTTQHPINTWNGNIYIKDSTLFSNYSSTVLNENDGNYTFNENNKYYGTNIVPANGTYSFEFEVLTYQSQQSFEYSYTASGKDDQGNRLGSSESKINTVYGGNNQGRKNTEVLKL